MGVARTYLDFDTFVEIFTKGVTINYSILQGIPENAEILNGGYSEEEQKFYVDFAHKDYEDFVTYPILPVGIITKE